MAVVASAAGAAITGGALAAGTIGAGLLGGAVIGAGAGALYSAVTGDGNILNSALTGALIGGGVGAAGAAAGPALMGEAAAGATAVTGAEAAASASPALQAAQGLTSANVAGLEQAALSQGVFPEMSAALPGAGLQAAPSVIAPSVTPAVSSAAIDPTTGLMAKTAADKISNKELLGYGLAGTAALSLLGSQHPNTLSSTNTGTSSPAMIRPYTYSQTKNPNYGQPGEPYFIQTNTPGTPYKAATGGLMAIGGPVERMSQGMMGGQQNMYPQSQQEHTNFATPTQMPASAEIIRSDYDTKTSPYTGDIMMARGGIARYADGGLTIEDLLAKTTQAQTPPPPAPMPAPVAPATLVAPSTTYAPAAGSTQATVANMYRDVLGRAPEGTGGQFWENAVNNGMTPEQLRSQFIASPENVANERLRTQIGDYNRNIADSANQEYNVAPPPLAGLPGGGQNASASDLKKIINQYYLQNLGRQGDTEGVDFWTNAVQNTGMTLGDVVKNIRTSPEGTVRNLYQELLGRAPDAEGGQYWSTAVANGLSADALRNEFINSQEYLNKHPESFAARQAQAAYEAAPITQENFDANAYLAANHDVARNWQASPWEHYVRHGQGEGRQAPRLAYQAPSTTASQSDIEAYMAAHPTSARTYNAATKTYSTPTPSAAEVAAWKASQVTQDDPAEDPAFKAWQLQQWQQAQQANNGSAAAGGLMPGALRYAAGGGIPAYNLGGYSDGGRLLKGPGDGMSDNIPASIADKQPARLADGEFVVPADVVSHLGNGSTDAGAKRLYSMMDNVRKARTGNKKQGKQIKADKYLPT